jgi:hypothetical protein
VRHLALAFVVLFGCVVLVAGISHEFPSGKVAALDVKPKADAPPAPAKVDPPAAKVPPAKEVCGCLDCQCEDGKPCACAGACKCPDCPGQIKKADRPIHVSPDGTLNELHPDGIYRPIPGAPKQKAKAAAVVPSTLFVPACVGGR